MCDGTEVNSVEWLRIYMRAERIIYTHMDITIHMHHMCVVSACCDVTCVVVVVVVVVVAVYIYFMP